MKQATYISKEKLFIYPTESAVWHFLPIAKKIGQEIKERFGKNRRGFGSIPVKVVVGKSKWTTSIFPDRSSGSYILPLKAKVRRDENIEAGDLVEFRITIG